MEINRRGFVGILGKAVGGLLVSSMLPNIAEAKPKGTIYLPVVGEVGLRDLVLPNGNFDWNEVTHYGERIPSENYIVENVLKQAKFMEDIRKHFGNRVISVNSWYRAPTTNKSVGGAKDSRYLHGDAVDFNVEGMKPYEVHEALEKYWGSNGGLGRYNLFTHVDSRGHKARWNGS